MEIGKKEQILEESRIKGLIIDVLKAHRESSKSGAISFKTLIEKLGSKICERRGNYEDSVSNIGNKDEYESEKERNLLVQKCLQTLIQTDDAILTEEKGDESYYRIRKDYVCTKKYDDNVMSDIEVKKEVLEYFHSHRKKNINKMKLSPVSTSMLVQNVITAVSRNYNKFVSRVKLERCLQALVESGSIVLIRVDRSQSYYLLNQDCDDTDKSEADAIADRKFMNQIIEFFHLHREKNCTKKKLLPVTTTNLICNFLIPRSKKRGGSPFKSMISRRKMDRCLQSLIDRGDIIFLGESGGQSRYRLKEDEMKRIKLQNMIIDYFHAHKKQYMSRTINTEVSVNLLKTNLVTHHGVPMSHRSPFRNKDKTRQVYHHHGNHHHGTHHDSKSITELDVTRSLDALVESGELLRVKFPKFRALGWVFILHDDDMKEVRLQNLMIEYFRAHKKRSMGKTDVGEVTTELLIANLAVDPTAFENKEAKKSSQTIENEKDQVMKQANNGPLLITEKDVKNCIETLVMNGEIALIETTEGQSFYRLKSEISDIINDIMSNSNAKLEMADIMIKMETTDMTCMDTIDTLDASNSATSTKKITAFPLNDQFSSNYSELSMIKEASEAKQAGGEKVAADDVVDGELRRLEADLLEDSTSQCWSLNNDSDGSGDDLMPNDILSLSEMDMKFITTPPICLSTLEPTTITTTIENEEERKDTISSSSSGKKKCKPSPYSDQKKKSSTASTKDKKSRRTLPKRVKHKFEPRLPPTRVNSMKMDQRQNYPANRIGQNHSNNGHINRHSDTSPYKSHPNNLFSLSKYDANLNRHRHYTSNTFQHKYHNSNLHNHVQHNNNSFHRNNHYYDTSRSPPRNENLRGPCGGPSPRQHHDKKRNNNVHNPHHNYNHYGPRNMEHSGDGPRMQHKRQRL